MLGLPIYLRGTTYYLHTRIAGKQFKRSQSTNDRKIAIIRAFRILDIVMAKQFSEDWADFNLDKVKKFEIDLSKRVLKADGPEDHQRMMEALELLKGARVFQQTPAIEVPAKPPKKNLGRTGLTIKEVLDKFFLLKSSVKEATVLSYKNAVTEFADYLKNPLINDVAVSDVTHYQKFLAKKKNSTRTIDNKISILRTIFNFAIKQGYFFQKNPAENRMLQSNKERDRSGWAIFELEEIKAIYQSEFLAKSKADDHDYYWTMILGLLTGCRISEITGLMLDQFKVSEGGTYYIRIFDSKTQVGEREVPIPERLFKAGLTAFLKDKEGQVFRYSLRLGKGSGNAVGKKFKRHLDELKISRPKLVFHSLRKFVNDFFKKNMVPYEARCQFIGHEVEDVNNSIYADDFNVDQLAEIV